MVAITDKFNQATTTGRPSPAALTAVKTIGATSLTVDSTAEWPTDTAVHFIIYEVDANNAKVAGTQCDFKGIVNSATTINNLTLKAGTDREYPIGSKVIAAPTAAWADDVVEGIAVEHNQDGTHSDITATSITATGDVEATSFTITGQTTGLLGAVRYYTYDGTDIFIDGVDQNNAANTTTWTKPTNLKFVEVEVVGAGGGGGGIGTTSGTAGAGGGGEGELSKSKIAAGSLSSTETITVGAGGSAGGATGTNGGTGGTSSFGAHVTAIGGGGGTASNGASTSAARPGGAGGTGGTATFALRGAPGQSSSYDGNSLASGAGGGRGGATSRNSVGNGTAGNNGGGGGGGLGTGTTGQTGGQGGHGFVIVKEYF